MPPKLPFMKFKPKADDRKPGAVKQEGTGEPGEDDILLSSYQQQRLAQQLPTQSQANPGQPIAASVSTAAVAAPPPSAAAIANAAASRSAMPTATVKAEPQEGHERAGRTPRGTFTISGSAAHATIHAGAVVKTDNLLPNTIEDLQSFIDPQLDDARFLPIQSVTSSSRAAAAKVKTESDALHSAPQPQQGGSAPGTAAAVAGVGSGNPGTQFLVEHLVEQERQRRVNLDFFSSLSSSTSTSAGHLHHAGASDSDSDRRLLWLQLPISQWQDGSAVGSSGLGGGSGSSPGQGHSPFGGGSSSALGPDGKPTAADSAAQTQHRGVLTDVPPGKVGKLRVRRSGKVELVIHGISYEVSLEAEGSNKAMTQEVVAILPSPSGDGTVACYELGPVDRKAVCICVPHDVVPNPPSDKPSPE